MVRYFHIAPSLIAALTLFGGSPRADAQPSPRSAAPSEAKCTRAEVKRYQVAMDRYHMSCEQVKSAAQAQAQIKQQEQARDKEFGGILDNALTTTNDQRAYLNEQAAEVRQQAAKEKLALFKQTAQIMMMSHGVSADRADAALNDEVAAVRDRQVTKGGVFDLPTPLPGGGTMRTHMDSATGTQTKTLLTANKEKVLECTITPQPAEAGGGVDAICNRHSGFETVMREYHQSPTAAPPHHRRTHDIPAPGARRKTQSI